MKNLKTIIFIIGIILFCYALNVFALSSSTAPDTSSAQPPPANVGKGFIHNVNLDGNANNQNDQNNSDNGLTVIDTLDNLYFVDEPVNNRVVVYDSNPNNTLQDSNPDYVLGQPNLTTFNSGTTDSKLNNPQSIAYDSKNKVLFVADSGNNRVMVFDVSSIKSGQSAKNVLGQNNFSAKNPGSNNFKLDNPIGLSFNPANSQLTVKDSGNNRTMVFDASSIKNGQSAVNVSKSDFGSSFLLWLILPAIIIVLFLIYLLFKVIKVL